MLIFNRSIRKVYIKLMYNCTMLHVGSRENKIINSKNLILKCYSSNKCNKNRCEILDIFGILKAKIM